MKPKQTLKTALFLLLTAVVFSGCGGSSGGGSDDVGGLTYDGKSKPANIGANNAQDLTVSVLGVYNAVNNDNLGFKSEEPKASGFVRGAFAAIARLRKNLLEDVIGSPFRPGVAYRTPVDETESCDTGKLRIRGHVEESDGTADLSFIFDGCRLDGDLIDGELRFEILDLDLGLFFPLDMRLSFEKLRLVSGDLDFSIGGRTRLKADLFANQQRETISEMIIRNNDTDDMIRIVDLVSVYTFDDILFPNQVAIDIKSGRVYDSRYGYVKVSSPEVIVFTFIFQEFPDDGIYRMTADGRILVTVIDAATVRIQADTNDNLGDGYEFDVTLGWSDL